MRLTITLSLLASFLLFSGSNGFIVKRASGNDNGNFNNGTDNGSQNGNCFGVCAENDSGNGNGNVNQGDNNGNGNGNCEGNCVGNESGNGNGNENTNSSDNGNDNGNCVGNCFHNIEGNANGNANTDIEGQGNGNGNCVGNCFDRVEGNGLGNEGMVDDDGSASSSNTNGNSNCFGNCFQGQPMHQTQEYNPNADVTQTPISCRSDDHYMYYVSPGTHCRKIHRKFLLWGNNAPVHKFTCPAGTVLDVTICRCNHWYLTKVRTDCKSEWYSWAWGENKSQSQK